MPKKKVIYNIFSVSEDSPVPVRVLFGGSNPPPATRFLFFSF